MSPGFKEALRRASAHPKKYDPFRGANECATGALTTSGSKWRLLATKAFGQMFY
jgi:hypothetical protein